MKVLIDADACPGVIRDILFRAAERSGLEFILIANQHVRVPSLKNVRSMQVSQGFDAADHEIARRAEAGDLVVTSDIPLAAEVVEKGAHALSFRGERYTPENVRAKLNMRDFMDTMRSSGVEMRGGPSALGARDKQAFAQQLDTLVGRFLRQQARGQTADGKLQSDSNTEPGAEHS